jgi:hypothetical protein
MQNGHQKVNASIKYADIDGKPYAGKEVSYEVMLDARQTARGKGVTDDAGKLDIAFVNNSLAQVKSGNISTHIKLDAKQSVDKTVVIKATSAKVDVQFFPESGYLVNGIRSKVAFKAIGADGLGVDLKGTIVDDQNNALTDIAPEHLGMGAFFLLPEKGKTYTAKITYPDGSHANFTLPAANDRGYVLGVYNNSASPDVSVKISVSALTLQENQNAEINLVAQCGGNIIYAAKSKMETGTLITRIPKSRFPSGITQFTLFSATGEPLNERVAFILGDDLLKLDLNTGKPTYASREKVKMDISAKSSDGKPVVGSFSVSVINESKVPVKEEDESTILSNLLLTSDIRGYVEKPNYYFTNINDTTRACLDALMLTQGYRRFEWKKLMADSFTPAAYRAEKSLDVSGYLKTPGGKPIAYGKVSLFSNKGGLFFMDTISDSKGYFAFRNLMFTDSVKFVVQARTVKDRKNVEIDLENIPVTAVARSKNSPDVVVNISSLMGNYLQNDKQQFDDFLKYGFASKTHVLKEISISEKKKPILEHSYNLNGPGTADQVITSAQLQSCTTLSQCLTAAAHFVNFSGGQAFLTRGRASITLSSAMLVVLDGMEMESDFSIDDINPDDVAGVEVLRSGAYLSIYGSRGSNGVLIITTKHGGDDVSYERFTPGLITIKPIGYYKARQFYAPQYDDPKTNAKVADLRSTIYWKPNLVTDKDGNASLEFFTADTKGTYRAVIEGIAADGSIGRAVYRFKVE